LVRLCAFVSLWHLRAFQQPAGVGDTDYDSDKLGASQIRNWLTAHTTTQNLRPSGLTKN